MIWLTRLFVVLFALYLLAVVLAYVFQRNLLYFPPTPYPEPPVGMSEITAADGSRAWWSAPTKAEAASVMVFHGNASDIGSNIHIFRDLRAAGYGVLSVGYPGYPGNAGRPSQDGLVDAATAQYDWLRRQDIAPTRIALYGTSLGSGVAAQVAARRDVGLIVLDAPFLSTLAIAKANMRLLPVELMMTDTYRSDLALAEQEVPLVWIHGSADRVIPVTSGQALFDGYTGPKTAHVLDGAGHADTWVFGGRDIVLAALSGI